MALSPQISPEKHRKFATSFILLTRIPLPPPHPAPPLELEQGEWGKRRREKEERKGEKQKKKKKKKKTGQDDGCCSCLSKNGRKMPSDEILWRNKDFVMGSVRDITFSGQEVVVPTFLPSRLLPTPPPFFFFFYPASQNKCGHFLSASLVSFPFSFHGNNDSDTLCAPLSVA